MAHSTSNGFRYARQLKHCAEGLCVWHPTTRGAVGDVGYLHDGSFHCLFNVFDAPDGLPSLPQPNQNIATDMRDNSHLAWMNIEGGNYAVGAGLPVAIDVVNLGFEMSSETADGAFLVPGGQARKVEQYLDVQLLVEYLGSHYTTILRMFPHRPWDQCSLIILRETTHATGWCRGIARQTARGVSGTISINIPTLGIPVLGLDVATQRAKLNHWLIGTGPPAGQTLDLPLTTAYCIIMKPVMVRRRTALQHRIASAVVPVGERMKSFMHKFRINAGSEVRSTVYTQTSPTNIAAGEIQDGSGTPEPPRRHNDDNYNFSLNSTYDTVSLQPESSTNLPTEDLLQESLLEDNIDPRNELEELLDNFLEKHSDFDAALGSWELLVDSQKNIGPNHIDYVFSELSGLAPRKVAQVIRIFQPVVEHADGIPSAEALARYNNAIVESHGPIDSVNDLVYQYWYKSNIGDILQPAPMAIAVLGQLSLVASTVEFNLEQPRDGFERVRYPNSFRATIIQIIDTGAIALQKSYANFDELQKSCAGFYPGVKDIVALLAGVGCTSQEEANANIRTFLPSHVSRLQKTVDLCLQKTQDTDTIFDDLLNLTLEVHESCTATHGRYLEYLRDAEMRQAILFELKRARATVEEQAEARRSFEDAQQRFNKTEGAMSRSWNKIEKDVIQGLSGTVTCVVDTSFRMAFAATDALDGTINAALNTAISSTNQHVRSVVYGHSSDPGYQMAEIIRMKTQALEAFVTGGHNSSVNWDMVGADRGARWIKSEFEVELSTTNWTSDPASCTAKGLVEAGAQLAGRLADLAANADNFAVVQPTVIAICQLACDAAKFAMTAMFKTGTAPVHNPGFAGSTNQPSRISGAETQIAVKNAQFRFEAMQQQLNFARIMSQNCTEQLLQTTESLSTTLGEIASLNPQTINPNEIRSILFRVVSFLCQLKTHSHGIVHLFEKINTLVGVTMRGTCNELISIIDDASKANMSAAGVTLSNWTRQAIYDQALSVAKISKLVEKISATYVTMYDHHVQEGIQKLLYMVQHINGDESSKRQLQSAGTELQLWARTASGGITNLIRDEQQRMEQNIEGRMAVLQSAVGGILPPLPTAIKRAVTESTEAAIIEASESIEIAAANKPVFKPRLGMMLM